MLKNRIYPAETVICSSLIVMYLAAPDPNHTSLRLMLTVVRLVRYDMKIKFTDFLNITSQDDSGMKTVELNKCKQLSQNYEVKESANAYLVFKNHVK